MVINKKTYKLKDGRTLVIRCPLNKDAETLVSTYRKACGESRNLSRGPDDFNITNMQERMLIKCINESERQIMLAAFVDGEHAGNADIAKESALFRDRHRCTLGIMLLNQFTGLGIGTILITELSNIAKSLGYEQIELEVIKDNIGAIRLYEKLGFIKTGITPRGKKYSDNTYADVLNMVKFID